MSIIQFIITNGCILLFVLVYRILLSTNTNLRANRVFLLSIPFISAVIAVFRITDDQLAMVSNYGFQIEAIGVGVVNSSNQTSQINVIFLVYAGITALLLLRLVYILVTAIGANHDFQFNYKNARVYLNSSESNSHAFFSRIILSKNDLNNTHILQHEYAHCKYGHSWDVMYGELIKCFFWFNPGVHMWLRCIKLNHEYAADRYTVDQSNDKNTYIKALLSETFRTDTHRVLGSPFSNQSDLASRISMLKHLKTKKIMKHLAIIPFSILLFLSASLLKPVQTFGQSTEADKTELKKDMTLPSFPGGDEALRTFITTHIKYPKEAKEQGIEETVVLKYIVNQQGDIVDVSVVKGENDLLIEEAKRVIGLMPKWEPATAKGKKVNVTMALPFNFKIKE